MVSVGLTSSDFAVLQTNISAQQGALYNYKIDVCLSTERRFVTSALRVGTTTSI